MLIKKCDSKNFIKNKIKDICILSPYNTSASQIQNIINNKQ